MDKINWNKLKTFYKVASMGSFNRAAERYHMDATALSKMVKSFENELNCTLLVRNKEGVELTPKGQLLYRDALRIDKLLSFTEGNFRNEKEPTRNHLKIVAPVGITTIYISRFINSFMGNFPNISLEVVSFDQMSLNEKLSGHILIHPPLQGIEGYTQEHLIKMELQLYASPEYLSKYGTPLTMDDLDNHRLIAFTQNKELFVDLNWHLRKKKNEKNRTPVFEADANFGRCYLAHRGVGIISVPKQHPDIKKYGLIEVLPDIKGPQYDYHLIVDKLIYENENVQKLLGFLKDEFIKL